MQLRFSISPFAAHNTCVKKGSVELAQTLKLALIGTHGVGKTTLAY